jgi:hypothetical protein
MAKWRVKWLNEYSTSYQHLWYIDSKVAPKPPMILYSRPLAIKINQHKYPNSASMHKTKQIR